MCMYSIDNIQMLSTKKEYEEFKKNWLNKRQKMKKRNMKVEDLYNKTEEWVLEVSKQNNKVPVDLSEILETFDITARPMDFSEIERRLVGDLKDAKILGALVPNGEDVAIFYSDKHEKDSHRNRFTIAHEIAHCCLQGKNSHVEFRIAGIELDETEKLANTFAGALLIPEKTLRKIMNQLILPSLHILADIFEVSENVMRARLKHLNIQSGIVGYNL